MLQSWKKTLRSPKKVRNVKIGNHSKLQHAQKNTRFFFTARQATLFGPKCAFMCAEAQWIAPDKDGRIASKSACVISY